MRLREVFPGGREEPPLDIRAERKLAAVDAGLARLPVDADYDDLATLARDLRDERELPSPEFSARLDRWAAEGFPETPGESSEAAGATTRLRRWLGRTPPRRLALGAAGALTVAVVAAVAIISVSDMGDDFGGSGTHPGPARVSSGAGAGATSESGGGAAPDATVQKSGDRLSTGAAASAGSGASVAPSPAPPSRASDVPFDQRKVARHVDLALSIPPDRFRDAADGVLDVVEQHNGFVRDSSVSQGGGGTPTPVPLGAEERSSGEARFDLRIPAKQLQSALGALSDLGHVVSRTDGSVDVTSRFLAAQRRIADLEDSRRDLLAKLADATTTAEQESIKRSLRIVEGQLAGAQEAFDSVRRRVQLVPVSVTISADRDLSTGGGWSIGDAFDDAGRVLEVAAGVLVVSAAVLLPVGLLCVLAWLAAREVARRRREGALD
jgi:hypothetical protein